MLERFTCRAIVGPILLVLVEVQHPFENRNNNAEAANDPCHFRWGWASGGRADNGRQEGNDRSGPDLNDLDPLKISLVGYALAIVPTNLIFQPLHNRICGRVRSSAHSLPILTRIHQYRWQYFAVEFEGGQLKQIKGSLFFCRHNQSKRNSHGITQFFRFRNSLAEAELAVA